MRLTKTLGAIVLAATAMALALAGPASADVFCKKAPEMSGLCPTGESIEMEKTFKGHTGEVEFKNAFVNAKCQSDILGKTTKNLGAGSGLEGEITELKFTSCSGCTSLTAEAIPWKATFLAGAGTVTFNKGGGGAIPKIKFMGCTGGITCVYGAAAIALKFKSSTNSTTPAHIEVGTTPALQSQAGSNPACPGQIDWAKADYEIEDPLPVWLTLN